MRKICSSAKTSCSLAFSDRALARSVPKGFSMTMRESLDQVRLAQQLHRRQRRVRRHAQVVQPAALATEGLLGPAHGRRQAGGTGGQRHVVEPAAKALQSGSLTLRVENSSSAPRAMPAKAVGVDVVERHADDAAARDEPGARQVVQAGQQLAPRQVAGGADQHDHLGQLRTVSLDGFSSLSSA